MSVPTAENIANTIDNEYFKINGYYLSTTMPIEFAKQVAITLTKLHVTAALKEASDTDILSGISYKHRTNLDMDAILNAYPLDKIK